MKDNDLHPSSAEADFDERCRSLLEDRAVAAPGPRADLFAAASTNAGTARLWYGGAAALLIAGAFLWFSWPMEEPMVPEALPELMNQEIPEAIGEGVVDREDMDDLSLESESHPVDEPVATRDAAPADVRNMEQSDLTMEVDAVAPELSDGGGTGVTVASPMVTSPDEDQVASEKMSLEPLQEDAVTEEAVSEPADAAPPSNPEPSNTEGASESKPRLTLPLTLPSGGGQR